MKNKRIYLCGPMDYRTKEDMEGWRDYATRYLKQLGDVTLDPTKWEGDVNNTKHIVEFDKAAMASADIILANCTDLGNAKVAPIVGSLMEIIWAWENNKIVLTVVKPEQNRIWLEYHSHKMFSELDAALEYIKRIPRWF